MMVMECFGVMEEIIELIVGLTNNIKGLFHQMKLCDIPVMNPPALILTTY